MPELINTSFAGGEASTSFWGRTDEARFHVSASVIRNCFINFRGGVNSRAGTAFVGPSWPNLSAPPRTITFRFNISTDFVLVFGDKRMRVVFQGGYVTLPPTAITAATHSSPCVVTIPAGVAGGSLIFIQNVGGMTQLNGNFYFAQSVTATTFSLYDVFGNPVNSQTFTTYVSGGTAAQIYEVESPYAIADLPYLKFTQSADVMSICCVNTATQTEYPPYDLDRLSNTNWQFVETTFQVSIAAPTGLAAVASTTTPPTTTPPTLLTNYAYVVTAVSSTTGEESQASNVAYVQSVDIAATAGSITLTWSAVTGAAYYNVYKAPAAYEAAVPIGSQFGYAGSPFGTQFVDSNITQDFTTTPPIHQNPFARGQIIDVPVLTPGSGLSQATTGYTISTLTGSGFVGSPLVVNGQVVGFYIQSTGQKYLPADTMQIVTVAAAASGTLIFSVNPTATHTIVLNGVTWTFVASGATGNQTNIQSTAQLTIQQLATDLAASANGSINVANYSASYLVLTIIYKTTGAAGNAYTLAGGTEAPTLSGPTLTGGADAGSGGGATVSLKLGPQSGTYPGVVGYFQQRRVYGATTNNPDTYFMSQTGAYSNMDESSPPVANDAITGSPWAQQVNGIQWLQPMPGGLIVGTGLDAWQLSGTSGAGSVISPAQQDAQPQESNGFHPLLPPIKVNYDILYVQSLGTIVRDLEYNFFVNIYAGQDISLYSNHLFEDYQLVQWAWAKEPYKIIWAVRDDGKLLSLTYVKEQKVSGWSRHDTLGQFVSVTTASEPPIDAVYFATQRYIRGPNASAYFIERMDDRAWRAAEDSWCVDCGLALAQPTPAGTLSASSAVGIGTLVYPTVTVGGTGYVDPAIVAIDPTQPGVRASGLATVVGGVITSFVINGVGFKAVQITVTDAVGTGAKLTCSIQNLTTLTSSGSPFSPGSIGQVIRMGGGVLTVQRYINVNQVVAVVNQPILLTVPNDPYFTPVVVAQGDWTMTTPVSTITNLGHLEGMQVSILADGNVVPGQTVTNGAVTLPAPASDVKVGLPFVAQVQALHTDVSGAPTVQGKSKRVSGVTVRMEKSRGVQVGANQPIASTFEYQQEVLWGQTVKMRDLQDRVTSNAYGAPIPLFTGDKSLPIDDVWLTALNQPNYGMVAAQQLNPLPMNILCFTYKIDFGS